MATIAAVNWKIIKKPIELIVYSSDQYILLAVAKEIDKRFRIW